MPTARCISSRPLGVGAHLVDWLRIDRAAITTLRARLEALPIKRREDLPGLKAERADIIVAGAVVVEELMAVGGYPAVTVCMQGVRDGLLIRETFKESLAA